MEEAKWLCDCGIETVQPQNEKMVTHCKCGKEHWRIKRPDGVIEEYIKAPEWWVNEFKERNKHILEKDTAFKQLAYRSVKLQEQVEKAVEDLDEARKKMERSLENALRREKLLKRKDMGWFYNPIIKKFMGVPHKATGGQSGQNR